MSAQPDTLVDIPLGSVLGGKYRVDKLLGQGGMGAVYLAENVDIGRKVAIKVLHADFASDQQVLQRFRMEARAAAAIGHPGIVDVLDLGTTAEGAEFIVMERLDGETLGARIKRQNVLQAAEVVPIMCEVFDALAAAHEKKIVHRDLKPENVFLCERPVKQAKILDFGISKFGGAEDVSLTRTGTVMGSPLYMSPEQARGAKDIGPSTDLYSMGAILYEALAGVPPFNGATYNEVIANVLMEPHKPLVEVKPDIPLELSQLVDRLLAKNAADRPPDARTAKLELKRAFDPTSTDVDMPTARVTGPTPAAAPSVARASIAPEAATRPAPELPTAVVREQRKTALVVVGAGLVVVLGAAGFAVWNKGRHSAVVAAPAPAPAPAPPPVEKPRAPDKIELKLAADPPAATWSLDGEALKCNPCTVVREQGSQHVAIASAPGFADARLEVLFDRAREEKAQLSALKTAPPPRPHKDRPAAVEKPADKPADKPKPAEKKDPALNIDKDNPFK